MAQKRGLKEAPIPEIGQRLAVARKAAKLTQSELAALSGVDQPALSRFEQGGRGLESGRLVALLRAASEVGINVEGFVLRGVGKPLHEAEIITADPELREALRVIRARLEKEK